jgi:hypothetical protein
MATMLYLGPEARKDFKRRDDGIEKWAGGSVGPHAFWCGLRQKMAQKCKNRPKNGIFD